MAADAGIFQQYLSAPKSMADYSADYDKVESNKLTLAASRMTNQTAQQAMDDDKSSRQALIQSGGDSKKALNALQAAGLYKQAQAMQKSMLDNQKTQSDIDLAKSHAGKFGADTAKTAEETRYMAATNHAQGLARVRTPQDVISYFDTGIASGVFPAAQRDQMIQQANQYPTLDAWKQAEGQAAIPVLDRYKTEAENARNKATNDTSIANNTANNVTSVANNKATNATTQRGQNMTDSRAREVNSTTLTKPFEVTGSDGAPVLVRQDKQGNISRVEGFGPKSGSVKLTEDQGKATGWLVQAENAFSNMQGAMTRSPSAAKPGFNDALGAVPGMGGIANTFRGADRQQFMHGASSLSEALLRAATGAGVNKEEAIQKIQELTPIFGEADATTKQKMDSIPLYIESLKVRSGPGAKQVPGILERGKAPAAPTIPNGWTVKAH